MIKSKIDENIYECTIKKSKTETEESMLILMPIGEEEEAQGEITKWSNTFRVNVRIILSDEKRQTVDIMVGANDKAMAIAEQMADLFGETKYSISFFHKS